MSTWTALADPTRRAILDVLRERPHAVGELVDRLDLAQPAASKHLATLRRAGLVHATVDAQRRVYALDPRPFVELEAWLAPYRALWSDALDRLDAHLHDHQEDR
ncbi:ArsR/SmtB family transcription factor [Actinomycetospora soli]|uniref:ArsR/SmtB family transcription factor n=1 Tax=Actinomycetospora soli TaxID=2893887 RepID=UPI001E65D774|nr:metalloregulator ArsR/SmtB family transcription factor [Actinomycetospora soli]MCD2185555.1 metalloregulator ArsR/SmtB family transcription factor [Actinomycetospora soli]